METESVTSAESDQAVGIDIDLGLGLGLGLGHFAVLSDGAKIDAPHFLPPRFLRRAEKKLRPRTVGPQPQVDGAVLDRTSTRRSTSPRPPDWRWRPVERRQGRYSYRPSALKQEPT
ncbi:hypothetical protein ABT147_28840 [Streptomyces sp. NPDC001868]|uniref:hypothetical protein n=1 Tax=Streptomyces sp. NPDC001868 TaxID=3154401 RepID=UPI0033213D35